MVSLKLIGGILRYIAVPAGSCKCENRSYPRLIELDKKVMNWNYSAVSMPTEWLAVLEVSKLTKA